MNYNYDILHSTYDSWIIRSNVFARGRNKLKKQIKTTAQIVKV